MSYEVQMSLTPTGASLAAEPRRPRLYLTYVLLTAFNILAVCFGMLLNQRLVEVNSSTVADNQHWVGRRQEFSHLSDLATALESPGNDVFETRDTSAESAKLHGAFAAFNERLSA